MTNHTNVVLLGDFNIYAQDIENPDSLLYSNMMETLGLQQHIDKPVHKLGNTLYLIFRENLNGVKVLHSFIGNFILDDRVVGIELEIRKQQEKHQSARHRNYKEFNLNSFSQEFNNNKILEQSSLKDAVWEFNEEMERTLDIIAPLEEKKKLKRKNKPQYTSQLLKQRKIVRNKERVYIKYRENHHWKAFTREQNRYNRNVRLQ